MLSKTHGTDVWALIRKRVASLTSAGLHVMLYGPPGTGKSFLAAQVMGQRSITLTLTEEMAAAELRGHWIPDAGNWRFHLGPVSTALRNAQPLILNELGRASGDVYSYLLSVMDGTVNDTLPNGDRVTHPIGAWSVIGTSNDGPDAMRPELIDRLVPIEVPVPDPAAFDTLTKLPVALRDAAWPMATIADPARRIPLRSFVGINAVMETGASLDDALVAVVGPDATRAIKEGMALASVPK